MLFNLFSEWKELTKTADPKVYAKVIRTLAEAEIPHDVRTAYVRPSGDKENHRGPVTQYRIFVHRKDLRRARRLCRRR